MLSIEVIKVKVGAVWDNFDRFDLANSWIARCRAPIYNPSLQAHYERTESLICSGSVASDLARGPVELCQLSRTCLFLESRSATTQHVESVEIPSFGVFRHQ